MSKLETMYMVSEMTGLHEGYVVEASEYFHSFEEAFHWLYLSGDNPYYTPNPSKLVRTIAAITVEEMQERHVNTPLEYMVLDNDHIYVTPKGIAYLRIIK